MNDQPIWKMIKEAADFYRREMSYSEIKDFILERWSTVKRDSITTQIIAVSVNHPSRIHYQENKIPRKTNGKSDYDMLFHTSRGKVTKYDPLIHGVWEIFDTNGIRGIREILTTPTKTHLFVWNPIHWPWGNLQKNKDELELTGSSIETWSCGSTKAIYPGERFFLIRVGEDPKGIIGSGLIKTRPHTERHFKEDRDYTCVHLEFDTIIDPKSEGILSVQTLTDNGFVDQVWIPRSSGISINPVYVERLEELWFETISTIEPSSDPLSDEENEVQFEYFEGAVSQVVQTRYERNPFARKACLDHWGYNCDICGFNFQERYGDVGKDFIHVHHLTEISLRNGVHRVNPITDLRPVCPNCHAMLHKQRPAFYIDQIKQQLKQKS